MIASRASITFALSSLVALSLVVGMTPASGTEPGTPTPAAFQEAQPAATEAAAPPAEPTRSSTADPSPTAVPSPAADPSPAFEDTLTIRDYQQNPELLAELIGDHGASMGQGLNRLEATGDPQEPAPGEALSGSSLGISETDSGAAMAPTATNYWQPSSGVLGVDVSSHQGAVNWGGAWNYGSRFAYVKATEALSYKNPYFGSQYSGSANQGMIRGAYHFAIPSISSGAQQANYFIANGGGWSRDGKTLPPLLDVEYNPYASLGNSCYNMSPTQMVNWIRDFSNTMLSRTGRVPAIYSTTDWWRTCTGNSSAFVDHPLHIAAYGGSTAGTLPNGWGTYSFWQYTDSGPVVGDWNQWNGSLTALQQFALGSSAGGSGGTIHDEWLRTGGASGPLGPQISGSDKCGLYGGGCYQSFTSGNIYWTAATGAHAVAQPFMNAWRNAGWQMGIGYPLQSATASSGYRSVEFEKAFLLWTSTGVRVQPK